MKLSRGIVGKVKRFKYIRSVIPKNYGFEEYMKHRIKYG